MTKKVGIFIIHGMGDPEPGYAEGLIRRLSQRFTGFGDEVEFEACYWAPILQDQQNVTWRRVQASGEVDAKALRRWVMSALGDPASYLSGYFKTGKPVYATVHDCIRSSLQRLAARLDQPEKRPLVVLAHSLGSVMVSNYIWDEQHGRGVGATAFERMETLTGLITYGSNIPLFLPPAPPVECIRFPWSSLSAELRPVAAWENVYDADDILGYPISKIWDINHGTAITDIKINAGVWPISQLPFTHTAYAQDDDLLDVIEKRVRLIHSRV
jgi:hypothetical protein